jgi:hypothetical protein
MKLNHADIIVKRTMLKNPLTSKSRLAVLSHILLREPFAQWGADGCVHVDGVKETNPRKAVLLLPRHLVKPLDMDEEIQTMMPDYYEAKLVERNLEIMQYSFMEKNIDVFAKRNLSHQPGLDVEVLKANAANPLIFNVPDNVEASWKKAALEVIDAAMLALKKENFISVGLDGKAKDPLNSANWSMGYWACMYKKFHTAREKIAQPVNDLAVAEISAMWDAVVNTQSQ